MRILSTPIVINLFLTGVLAAAVPEHLENSSFDAKKIPDPNQPAVLAATLEKDWREAEKSVQFSCTTHEVFKSQVPSTLTVAAMKNRSTPVKAGFKHFEVYLAVNKKTQTSEGIGIIDLSSYNSGTVDRDRRIQRLIFEVEKPNHTVATFTFSLAKGLSAILVKGEKGTSFGADLDAQLKMGSETYVVMTKSKITKVSGNTVHIISDKDVRFTYATDEMVPRLKQLITACNHQFLSTFVDVGFDLTLVNMCRK